MIYSKQGGVKVLAHKIANKDGYTAKGAWVKTGGLKKRVLTPIPDNMIILYSDLTDIPSGADIMDGTLGTEDLIDWYAQIESVTPGNIFNTTGSFTHNASVHGSKTQTISARSNSRVIEIHSLSTNGWSLHYSTHGHPSGSHIHSGVKTTGIPNQGLIPTIGEEFAAAGSIWLMDTEPDAIYDLLFELWDSFTNGNHLWFTDANSVDDNSPATTHSHEEDGSFNANDQTQTRTQDSRKRSYTLYYSHGHYVRSTVISSVTHEPYHMRVGPYQSLVDVCFLDILPSGTLGLFTTDTIPDGWTDLAAFDQRGLKLTDPDISSLGAAGGSIMHLHPANSGLSNHGDFGVNSTTDSQSGGEQYSQSLADHSGGSHQHTVTGGNTPPSKSIWVASKD